MLSPTLLEVLRDWYRIARPQVFLFPGRDKIGPMTTRQFNRICHLAAKRAGPAEVGRAAHAEALLRDASAREQHRRARHPGPARACAIGHHRALYAGGDQRHPAGDEPASTGSYRSMRHPADMPPV